ncbi:16S rRNA (guanine(527)-N(7))-methyltransferase RsmG [Campylobacter sp.]|uniref:16S rRNA (guanine(527)-N(7))-methyltransferase RsmG n=1 Tax=Campylobacter sp. TaxID=205 RepID=UPI003FA07CA4
MKNELSLPANFDEKIKIYAQIFTKFNAVHSLSNYKDIGEQVLDSIEPLEIFDLSAKTAIDVGSGAGFPAIFLALAMPQTKWHLFEPIAKKSSFLSYAKIELGLENLEVHSQKIELTDKFTADLITSRALSKTKELIRICDGFYDEKTKFLIYKGSSVMEEISGIDAQIYNEKNRNYIFFNLKNHGERH